jgi:RNA polymerase sigma factor (sigma-70 family)
MHRVDQQSNSQQRPGGQFATTHWSLVLAAGNCGNEESSRALEKLCRAYWPPLYAYVRRRVSDIHEAQDLTQAFFERLLEKRYLADADPERGRFRAFLITTFKHFLSNEWDKAKAQKRGGDRRTFSLDFASQDSSQSEMLDTLTAERVYERQWAMTLLSRVMDRLQREMERSGKGQQFHCLKELIGGSGGSSYAIAARDLGLSESATRMAASRLRRRYRDLLRDEIAQTVSLQEDIDSEVQHLFDIFSG